jgi:hypothetical protein
MDSDAPATPPPDAALDTAGAIEHLEAIGDERLAARLRGEQHGSDPR